MEKSPSPTEQPSSPTKSPTQKPAASAKSPASIKATSPTPSVEATVRDLVPDLADEAVADKPVAEVLKELPANDPKAAEIKKAVYVHTVPYTTRPRRENEVDGREYNFISREEFEAIVKADGMLEWGEKNGTLYGTAKVDSNEVGTRLWLLHQVFVGSHCVPLLVGRSQKRRRGEPAVYDESSTCAWP